MKYWPVRGGATTRPVNTPGDHILYHRNDLDPAGLQVWLVDIEGRDDREILDFGSRVKVYASWFPDGRRVLFVARRKHTAGWAWDEGTVRWLLDDPERNVEYARTPQRRSRCRGGGSAGAGPGDAARPCNRDRRTPVRGRG